MSQVSLHSIVIIQMYRKRKSYGAKRRYRRGYRRGYRRNYRRGRRFIVQRLKGRSGFPEKVATKLHYIETITLNSASIGAYSRYVYRGNSCYDPNQTGVGNQPIQWDDFTTLYAQYCVTSSKIEITAINMEDAPARIVVHPYYSSTDPLQPAEELQVHPRARSKILGVASSTASKCYLKNYSTTGSFYPECLKNKYQQNASVTSNPSLQWFWVVTGAPMLDTDIHTIQVQVKLTYYVTFTSRKAQGED